MNRFDPGKGDGVHAMVPPEKMVPAARKIRDLYARKSGAPILHREFGYYCLEEWHRQGLPRDADLEREFGYDAEASFALGGLGWCEAAFHPAFEEKVLEARGDHEVVQDLAGRHVLVFRGRRIGFMPGYLDHPVKDQRTWDQNVRWRLEAEAPGRFADLPRTVARARAAAGSGLLIVARCIGGYMYLRSLVGPEGLMYAWYDMPEVLHDCMRSWLALADRVTAAYQQHLTLDEFFLAEDICYNHGLLCGPDTMKEFLLPYYQQLIANIRSRQIDRGRHLFVQIDTDGDCRSAIPIYREAIGLDVMCPFEVASGCDVVEIGRQWPDLVMSGGIDKRVLARSQGEIDRMVERILPAMRRRGGYIPTCDHGVPAEVSLDNYRHYRKRCLELGG